MDARNIKEKMGTTKTLRTACTLAAILALASCSKEQESGGTDGPESRTAIRFSTEALAEGAAGAGTTYRIITYSGDANTVKYQLRYTGTYYLKNANDKELTACSVNDSGAYTEDDETAGMNGASGNLLLVAVSPGVKHETNGSFLFTPTTSAFKSSFPKNKSLGGYGSVKVDALKDCRATVGFKFYKNRNAQFNTLAISDLQLSGAGAYGEKVTLYPASRQVAVSNEAIGFELNDVQDTGESDADGNRLYYTATRATNAAQEQEKVYVAAAIYAPLTETAAYMNETYTNQMYKDGDYLYMTCKLTQDSRRDIPIRLPLTVDMPELEAQHHYTFKILISSDYITAFVEVFDKANGHDWEHGGDEESEITTPNYTVKLGTWKIVGNGNDWELEEIDNPSIGGN